MAHAVERTLDSAGDRARAAAPVLIKPREENNNEVEALSKELSGMGCIVDAVRSTPGCADGACVGDSASTHTDNQPADSEDAYLSEEFDASSVSEEDGSGGGRTEEGGAGEGGAEEAARPQPSAPAHSLASTARRRPARSTGDARDRSASRYGSLPQPQTRRVNMSFTNARLREIERENRILLNKILSARNSKRSSIPPPPSAAAAPDALRRPPPPPPAERARRQQQKRIDHDNLILLRKIQRASSSSCSLRR